MEEKNGMLDKELQKLKLEKEEAIIEVEEKYQQMLKDKEPKTSCAICYGRFTTLTSHHLNRACFNPCGHASVCHSCAGRLQRSTARCPICQAVVSNVSVVPSAIFF
ncbi:uncharacterized protein [Physcomitrium patens]